MTEKKIVVYYGSWSANRQSLGNFNVSDINPFLCTHLIYTFFGISETGELRILDPKLDLEDNHGRGNIKKFIALKNINPDLKVLAAVGGWNEGSVNYSNMAKDPAKRKLFVSSSRDFLLKHGFDGLDMDWEYPGLRGGDCKVDRDNFITLLKELRAELTKNNFLLTAAVGAPEHIAEKSYDIPNIASYLDFINVMTYDLRGPSGNVVGNHSSLYAAPSDKTKRDLQRNANACIQFWLGNGAPASKLILGVPFYARTFILQDQSKNTPGSPSTGPGLAGPYTKESGIMAYYELIEKFAAEDWTHVWDDHQKAPYAYRNEDWIGYDNLRSVELKAGLVNNLNLGGIMIWSIEMDDFRGISGEPYPLLKKINSIVQPLPEPVG